METKVDQKLKYSVSAFKKYVVQFNNSQNICILLKFKELQVIHFIWDLKKPIGLKVTHFQESTTKTVGETYNTLDSNDLDEWKYLSFIIKFFSNLLTLVCPIHLKNKWFKWVLAKMLENSTNSSFDYRRYWEYLTTTLPHMFKHLSFKGKVGQVGWPSY